MIAERGVDPEVRAELRKGTQGLAKDRLEPRRIVVPVGAERGAVGIDVVAEHGREIAVPFVAPVPHRVCDRRQAACRHPRAVPVLRHRGRPKLLGRPLVLAPVPALRSDELLASPRRLVVLRLEIIEVVAVIAEDEDPDVAYRRRGWRGGCPLGLRTTREKSERQRQPGALHA